ncbi:MAG: hypothetical protein AAGA45_03370 [Verrucomicrobiota bacterium]
MKLLALPIILLAILAALAGLVIPVQFGSVTEVQLIATANNPGNLTLAQLVEDEAFAGRVGPAGLLSALGPSQPVLREQINTYRRDYPLAALAGGPDPFFQTFLKQVPLPDETATRTTVNRLLVPQQNRATLLRFLEQSRNANVTTLLQTRELQTVTRFMPVSSPAGAPLDVAILTTALLLQTEAVSPELTRELRGLALAATERDPIATDQLEACYLSILGAARRMDWTSLKAWVAPATTWTELVSMTTLLRQNPEQLPLLFAALLLSERPADLATFLQAGGDSTRWSDLALAVSQGSLAVDLLLDAGRPVVYSPTWLTPAAKLLPPVWADALCAHPQLALTGKLALFFLAGFLLAIALKRLLAGADVKAPHRRAPSLLTDVVLGGILLVVLVLATEPNLLAQPVSEPGKLFLEFEIPAPAANAEPAPMENVTIDQITLLVLLIFLVIQLIIYSVCLLKLAQIRRSPVPASTKLQLLENEDNLFDTGLYVGLAGTVISLLMLALGIVQASLVAAYASTLFGIIFVALLKILNVRPLRRKLILEAQ